MAHPKTKRSSDVRADKSYKATRSDRQPFSLQSVILALLGVMGVCLVIGGLFIAQRPLAPLPTSAALIQPPAPPITRTMEVAETPQTTETPNNTATFQAVIEMPVLTQAAASTSQAVPTATLTDPPMPSPTVTLTDPPMPSPTVTLTPELLSVPRLEAGLKEDYEALSDVIEVPFVSVQEAVDQEGYSVYIETRVVDGYGPLTAKSMMELVTARGITPLLDFTIRFDTQFTRRCVDYTWGVGVWQTRTITDAPCHVDDALVLTPQAYAVTEYAPSPLYVFPSIYLEDYSVYLHACPHTSCSMIAELDVGDEVISNGFIDGEAILKDIRMWFRVMYQGQTAYIYSQHASGAQPGTQP